MGSIKDDLVEAGLELIETHTAWVLLSADTVWKIKKPVDYGFLDFTTLDRRRAACDAETRLNARLSPHVYQGLVPVTRDAGGRHHLGGAGDIVDWAVRMTRLPDAVRADVLLREGRLGTPEIERLAEHLARFHDALGPCDAAGGFGAPEAILGNVRENFAQAKTAIGTLLGAGEAAEIERHQVDFVERRRQLLDERIRQGRVRDGHGDLRLEHVYFEEARAQPTIIDCIEFNERFRYADVAADIAFLSMDLERLGRSDLAEGFLAAYARASGDYQLYELVDFYEGYRAYVRGKVSALLAEDRGADLDTRAAAVRDARSFFLLSLLEGREGLLRPAAVAVGGVIASGKSTIAEHIGAMMNAPIVDTDRARKALAGVEAKTPLRDDPWSGSYTPAFTERVYAEVFRRAGHVLSSGRAVVIDASFRSRAHRAAAQALARERGVSFYFVECRAHADEYGRRLERRARSASVSDGRAEIFDEFAAHFEPVTEIPEGEHLLVDTSLPLQENVRRLADELPTWPEGFNG